MTTTINFEVSYGQLAVFVTTLKQPFNDWTDRHVAQGFAWRHGSVSFRPLVECGPHLAEIEIVDHMRPLHPDTVRAIEVPFDIPADGAIEIGSITETIPLSLPAGSFLLRCEFLQSGDVSQGRVRLTFTKDKQRFAIVRADDQLSSDGELLTTAQAARA